MRPLYREINTLRILPLDFMHNLRILLNWGEFEEIVLPVIEIYYHWAMGHEIAFENGRTLYKALCLLGDNSNIQDYNARVSVWERTNKTKA